MKMAEKFQMPIITFIDTPGAYPGKEAEERGQAEAIARNLKEMIGINVPILSVVIGEGGSGGDWNCRCKSHFNVRVRGLFCYFTRRLCICFI